MGVVTRRERKKQVQKSILVFVKKKPKKVTI